MKKEVTIVIRTVEELEAVVNKVQSIESHIESITVSVVIDNEKPRQDGDEKSEFNYTVSSTLYNADWNFSSVSKMSDIKFL